jgi:hypothetical protein
VDEVFSGDAVSLPLVAHGPAAAEPVHLVAPAL